MLPADADVAILSQSSGEEGWKSNDGGEEARYSGCQVEDEGVCS